MLPKFIELKKNCKKDMTGLHEMKIALMGDCATQHIATAIKGFGFTKGFAFDVLDTDYNQVIPQVMDQESETYKFGPFIVLMAMCVEKLYEEFVAAEPEARASFAKKKIDEYVAYWTTLKERCGCKIIMFNFPEADDRVYGNFGSLVDSSFIRQVRELNLLLGDKAQESGNVYIVDVAYLQNAFGRSFLHDEKLYYSAKMTFAPDALPYIAKEVVSIIENITGHMKKCAVLDLDNTLWGGVVGDDGLDGIQIGELGIGKAFAAFQTYLKELTKRGVILAVCSKNDEDKAKEPFIKHPEMVLRLEDIAIFVANWEDKASNIRYIQKTLNIGMDSMVFFDDNPFERNLVSSMIPEITVPEMPEDPADYVSFVQRSNLFETISFSKDDSKRTKQYREEAGRVQLQASFSSYEDYLKNLEMVGQALPFDTFHYPRIAQLTQRSNQFNLRTIRYSEEDIKNIALDDNYVTRYFTLKDKFGDHGLISVVIMKKEDEALFVDTWLMSCRVLKRGMEEYIMNSIVAAAKEAGYDKLRAQYIKTPKNSMVEHIYDNMGWKALDDGYYELEVGNYENKKTYIN